MNADVKKKEEIVTFCYTAVEMAISRNTPKWTLASAHMRGAVPAVLSHTLERAWFNLCGSVVSSDGGQEC